MFSKTLSARSELRSTMGQVSSPAFASDATSRNVKFAGPLGLRRLCTSASFRSRKGAGLSFVAAERCRKAQSSCRSGGVCISASTKRSANIILAPSSQTSVRPPNVQRDRTKESHKQWRTDVGTQILQRIRPLCLTSAEEASLSEELLAEVDEIVNTHDDVKEDELTSGRVCVKLASTTEELLRGDLRVAFQTQVAPDFSLLEGLPIPDMAQLAEIVETYRADDTWRRAPSLKRAKVAAPSSERGVPLPACVLPVTAPESIPEGKRLVHVDFVSCCS